MLNTLAEPWRLREETNLSERKQGYGEVEAFGRGEISDWGEVKRPLAQSLRRLFISTCQLPKIRLSMASTCVCNMWIAKCGTPCREHVH